MIEFSFHAHEANPDIAVLELTGQLDNESSEFLLDTLQGLIDEGHSNFVLNCKELDYISSLGLASLIRAKSRLKHSSGAIALANVQGVIAEVIHTVHFDRVFHIFDSVPAAVDSIKQA